ncbi:PDZ domain-containing protein [Longimicrobium sp.]|uniref:M61 family metallopeptidase n=1 Tax=Longimicrobium sp. TaxID=2029185 RepID=UPI002BC1E1A6|nr:PDZ domain-containing protein [Longimicrobium sp.]HSU14604.1 PDZ domain-containing protein [Longimicrobium sp.]
MHPLLKRSATLAVATLLVPSIIAAQPGASNTATSAATLRSAPISNIRYEVTFTAQTAKDRSMHVDMTFDAASTSPVLLSLPVWTPGAYEVSNYAHWVSGFGAVQRGAPVRWDKVDPDTWRVRPGGAGPVTVSFEYRADSLDNAMAWAQPDFLFFNGTTAFLYPEGRTPDFPATITIRTDAGWNVATSMRARPGRFTYGESNYHDLVDMPFFVGRFDLDSMQVAGKWHRLATYPAGRLQDTARAAVWRGIAAMAPAEAAVFHDAPWPDYTTMMVFPEQYPGGSALEHSRSHLGIYTPELIGTPVLLDITAHEMFHSWNVKRLRPADMWPYVYDRAMPTVWLWVSEGITDYYAPLALVRGGVAGEDYLWENLTEKMQQVDDSPPVALEDASLSTWNHPQDGTGYLYYPKGALAGFLLDVMIRDASDNRRSLDTVMRELYEADFQRGRGFTGDEWWAAVSRAAGGRGFADFAARYVDGREPFPYARVLPLAGLRLQADTAHIARIGVQTQTDSTGVRVVALVPGGMAARAGLQVGDYIVSLGEVKVGAEDFGPAFRARYGTQPEGTPLPVVVRRNGQNVTLNGSVHYNTEISSRIAPDPNATVKAARIRTGIARGTTTGG